MKITINDINNKSINKEQRKVFFDVHYTESKLYGLIRKKHKIECIGEVLFNLKDVVDFYDMTNYKILSETLTYDNLFGVKHYIQSYVRSNL
jgi:hypothetical protein